VWSLVGEYTSATEATVKGLSTKKKTEYYFAAVAVAANGTVLATSNYADVTTQPKAPPPPPHGPCLILPGIVTVALAPAMFWRLRPPWEKTRHTRSNTSRRSRS
jgi:hypothetical protein